MKKVTLTQEQAKAFEGARRVHSTNEMLHVHTHETFRWEGKFEPLNELETSKLVRAIFAGYETEDFKVGDWVIDKELVGAKAFKIEGIEYRQRQFTGRRYAQHNGDTTVLSSLRHATKKEIWWAEHDRRVREVRKGDIIVNNTGYTLVVSTTEKEIVRFTNKGWIFKDEIEKGNYEIACFVEDRKDG